MESPLVGFLKNDGRSTEDELLFERNLEDLNTATSGFFRECRT